MKTFEDDIRDMKYMVKEVKTTVEKMEREIEKTREMVGMVSLEQVREMVNLEQVLEEVRDNNVEESIQDVKRKIQLLINSKQIGCN